MTGAMFLPVAKQREELDRRTIPIGSPAPALRAVRRHLPRVTLRARTRNALKIPFSFPRMRMCAQYMVAVYNVPGWSVWGVWFNCGQWRNSRFALNPPGC